MAITLNGTTGITTPDITSEAGLTADGVSFASGAPANTLVTTSGGNVGMGTSSPGAKVDIAGNLLVDAYNNGGAGAGVFFRKGFINTAQPSITLKDHNGNTAPDGLSINAYDGISFSIAGSESARIDSSGRLLVGTTTNIGGARFNVEHPTDCIGLNLGPSASGSRYFLYFRYNSSTVGSITSAGSTTTYATSSDYRLKENVVGVTGASARVQQLNPVRFNFIADPDTTVDGFLAHEVQDVVPEAITGTKDAVDAEGNPEYQGIDQSKLVPLLTAALQEALGKIETLEARVAALEAA